MKKLMKIAAGAGAALAAMTAQASAHTMVFLMEARRGGRHGGGGGHHGNGHHGNGNGHGHGGGHSPSSSPGPSSSPTPTDSGGYPAAPEIDVSQGAAAIILALLAFLVVRELYLRQRPAV